VTDNRGISHTGGYNVLYTDGHAKWFSDPGDQFKELATNTGPGDFADAGVQFWTAVDAE
jgi:prepilin-type processing-associated H-X9-DG protein